ncbi:MAG: hypothetical protein Sapg2KO_46500 [Saprospiraceae bacterium]
MGRPKSENKLPSIDISIVDYIKKMRQLNPGWGPKTIHAELKNDRRWSSEQVPSIRSIAYLLQAAGLSRKYDKRIELKEIQSTNAPTQAHQRWQLDAQGYVHLAQLGTIAMINIKDIYSKTYCLAYPNQLKGKYGHSKRVDYQCALRLAFAEFGLPQELQTDHEAIFYEAKSKSPFPTRFHLWLISLGITKFFSRKGRPQDQGAVERMHQTIEKQVLQGKTYKTWYELFQACQERRYFLNNFFPCSTLKDQPPFEAFPEARKKKRDYSIDREEDYMDLQRVYDYLDTGKWFRNCSRAKTVTIGGQVYFIKSAQPKGELEITFEKQDNTLEFKNDKGQIIDRHPIKGIEKRILMGQLFYKMSNLQLELPLDWESKKVSTTFLHNDSMT